MAGATELAARSASPQLREPGPARHHTPAFHRALRWRDGALPGSARREVSVLPYRTGSAGLMGRQVDTHQAVAAPRVRPKATGSQARADDGMSRRGPMTGVPSFS